jgi:hypothetical protein
VGHAYVVAGARYVLTAGGGHRVTTFLAFDSACDDATLNAIPAASIADASTWVYYVRPKRWP